MKGRPPKNKNYHKITKPKLYGELAERDEIEPSQCVEYCLDCPKSLSGKQRKEWRKLAELLEVYNLLIPANALVLERLSINMADYKAMLKKVSKTGIIIKGQQGFPVYNPFWNAQNKLEDKIHRDLIELGLSATGLARLGSLTLKARKQKDAIDDLVD